MPRGEILEQKTEAYIGEVWYTIAREAMTYNSQGQRITSENLAGQITTTAWNQYVCNPVDELISGAKLGGPGSVPAAGDTTTWLYGDGWWMIDSSCLCGRHRRPNSFLALLHFAADGEGHDRKNRSGQPEIAQTGVQAGMSYCINPTLSISSDPSGSDILNNDKKNIELAASLLCLYICKHGKDKLGNEFSLSFRTDIIYNDIEVEIGEDTIEDMKQRRMLAIFAAIWNNDYDITRADNIRDTKSNAYWHAWNIRGLQKYLKGFCDD